MWEFSEEYKRHIKSPAWKRTCTRYWAVYGRKCQACGTRQGSLQVHHVDYIRFGHEPLSDLMGLCFSCHNAVHQIHRTNKSLSLRLVTNRYVALKKRV